MEQTTTYKNNLNHVFTIEDGRQIQFEISKNNVLMIKIINTDGYINISQIHDFTRFYKWKLFDNVNYIVVVYDEVQHDGFTYMKDLHYEFSDDEAEMLAKQEKNKKGL